MPKQGIKVSGFEKLDRELKKISYKGPSSQVLDLMAKQVEVKTRTTVRKATWFNPLAGQVFSSQLKVERNGNQITLIVGSSYDKIVASRVSKEVLDYIKKAKDMVPVDSPGGSVLIQWQLPETVARLEETLKQRWLPTEFSPEKLLQLGVTHTRPQWEEALGADARRQLSE